MRLVGRDLHHGPLAEPCRLLAQLANDVVVGRAVREQVLVQGVVEGRELRLAGACKLIVDSLSTMSIDAWARTVWDYHHVGHALRKADCIIVLGSHDTRVAERGAELYLAGWAPLVLMSGGLGSLTSGMWTRPEAEVFADIALGMGVPRDALLLESRSTNTGENVELSRRLLAERGRPAALARSPCRSPTWSGARSRRSACAGPSSSSS